MANVRQRVALASKYSSTRTLKEMWDTRANDPMAVRLGKAALIDLPSRSAHITRAVKYCTTLGLVDRPTAQAFPGYKVIDRGGEQIVMANGSNILKLIKHTNSVNLSLLDDAAEELQTNSERCREYLGDRWVPTDFAVTRLPASERSVITASQPLIAVERFYGAARHLVRDDNVSAVKRSSFVEAIDRLHADTGLYPDLLGINNIGRVATQGTDCDGLRIVDTIAVTPINQALPLPGRPGVTVGEGMRQELRAMIGA